jgi:hypothetical protein
MAKDTYTQNELDMIEAFLKTKGAKKIETIDNEKYISNKSINDSSIDDEDIEDIPEINFDDYNEDY